MQSTDDFVAENATSNTTFFGFGWCEDNLTGRITSIQLYIVEKGSSDFIPLPQVGPTLPEDVVTCSREKLKVEGSYIEKATIYESEFGFEAIEFQVGDKVRLFGTPTEDAKKTVTEFGEDEPITSMSVVGGYTGLKGVEFKALDTKCIVEEEKKAAEKAEYDTALIVKQEEALETDGGDAS